MKLSEINLGFTLGSKQHADAVAAHRGRPSSMPVEHFLRRLSRSTMPLDTVEQVKQMFVDSGKTHVTPNDIDMVALATGADPHELLHFAGMQSGS